MQLRFDKNKKIQFSSKLKYVLFPIIVILD